MTQCAYVEQVLVALVRVRRAVVHVLHGPQDPVLHLEWDRRGDYVLVGADAEYLTDVWSSDNRRQW